MHYAALNYEPDGISASTKISGAVKGNQLNKSLQVNGSVTRVTDLSTLVGTNAIPVDYLIITHSSLFNSNSLTTLANHRRDFNGYDVAIVHIDDMDGINGPPPNYDCVYEWYPRATNYQSVRDFISAVYTSGRANHTGDSHLGYILLAGDALQDDNSTVMVPAAYPPSNVPPNYNSLSQGGDYYYSCTGGDNDNLQDVMYGRLSVGNETELSNVVNKIVSYENSSSGNWQNNITFLSFSPDLFPISDNSFLQLAQIVPSSNNISYAWRAHSADTAQAWGRLGFNHNITDDFSNATNYVDDPWFRRYTYWGWLEWEWVPLIGDYDFVNHYDGEYADPNNLCGADEIDVWLYNKINAGQHTFVYEGHGGWNALGANEGSARHIFKLSEYLGNNRTIFSELNNNSYPFMIFNCCDAGHLDHTSGDCVAEAIVNIANKGAIGVVASSRDSDTGGFGVVDKLIVAAQYNSLSHIMGEAVMESKLIMSSSKYKRQYNLYGDPAVNLWPTGYTVSENITISGNNTISENLTVASGVTLTVSAGSNLRFTNGASLTVNGTLTAVGTSANHITFDRSGTSGTWGGIVFNSGSSGSIEYCNISHATTGINSSYTLPMIRHNTITNNIYGIYVSNIGTVSNEISYNTIQNNTSRGICLYTASPKIYSNTISNNTYYGISTYQSSPYLYGNTITGHSLGGLNFSYYSSAKLVPWNAYGYYWGRGNNKIKNNTGNGISASYMSNLYLGSSPYGGYNSICNNTGTELSAYYNCAVTAQLNWWGAYPPNSSEFYPYQSTIDYTNALPTDPNPDPEQGMVRGPNGISNSSTINSTKSDLEKAYNLQLDGKFAEAIAVYDSYINANSTDSKSALALVRIDECYKLSGKQGAAAYLDNTIKTKANKNNELDAVSLELKNQYLIQEKKYEEAVTNFNELAKKFKANKDVEKHSLFNAGYVYLTTTVRLLKYSSAVIV